MIGSFIGDIVGSIYEFSNIKTKCFPFYGPTEGALFFTDDSVLTGATAYWILHGGNIGAHYAQFAVSNPGRGYGGRFSKWIRVYRYTNEVAAPYNSMGNGSGMRVGPVGWAAQTREEVMEMAKTTAECTHNHPEGIEGAQAIALAVWLARHGASAADIRSDIEKTFGYDLSMSVDEIRPRYSWYGMDGEGNSEICSDSVPQAITCALEAHDFEDAVRNAVSLGGDSDTIACMAGAVAEALFGIPRSMANRIRKVIKPSFLSIIDEFEQRFGSNYIED
jgi:ADP-ribosylglycohydrolase